MWTGPNRLGRVTVLLAAALAAAPVVLCAEPAERRSRQEVSDLISRLGSDRYAERQAAQQRLIEIGPPARRALAEAARSADPEVQQRAGVILEAIDVRAFEAASQAVRRRVLWSRQGAGAWAPAVAGRHVYAVTDDKALLAVDRRTGRDAWRFAKMSSKAAPLRPACGGGGVYVSDGLQTLFALDADTGDCRWAYRSSAARIGPPAYRDGVVYVGDANAAPVALSADRGRVLWSYGRGAATLGPPAAAPNIVCCATLPGSDGRGGRQRPDGAPAVVALDRTGRRLWRFTDGGTPLWGAVVGDGVACFRSAKALYAVRARSGDRLWTHNFEEGVALNAAVQVRVFSEKLAAAADNQRPASCCIADGVVYAQGEDVVEALDAHSGQVRWRRELADGNDEDDEKGAAAVVKLNQQRRVILLRGAGRVRVVGGQGGWVIAGGVLGPGGGGRAPAVAHQAVLVGTSEGLVALERETGRRLWRLKTAGPVIGRPAVADGVAYFAVAPPPGSRAKKDGTYSSIPPQSRSRPAKDASAALPPGLHAVRLAEPAPDAERR
jgi:outer membrane protein assembly factor BamB